jgi:hypothetical protein
MFLSDASIHYSLVHGYLVPSCFCVLHFAIVLHIPVHRGSCPLFSDLFFPCLLLISGLVFHVRCKSPLVSGGFANLIHHYRHAPRQHGMSQYTTSISDSTSLIFRFAIISRQAEMYLYSVFLCFGVFI